MDIVCWQFCCFMSFAINKHIFISIMILRYRVCVYELLVWVKYFWYFVCSTLLKKILVKEMSDFFFTVLGTTENIWGLTVMLIFCHVEFWREVIRSTRSFQTLHTIIYNLALASVSIAYSNPVTKTWVTTSVDSELSDYLRGMLTLCSSL